MEIKEAIEKAGGAINVTMACNARGMEISRHTPHYWAREGRLPRSEWTGDTAYARVICDLAAVFGHDIDPLDLCPGAGQYMRAEKAAA